MSEKLNMVRKTPVLDDLKWNLKYLTCQIFEIRTFIVEEYFTLKNED